MKTDNLQKHLNILNNFETNSKIFKRKKEVLKILMITSCLTICLSIGVFLNGKPNVNNNQCHNCNQEIINYLNRKNDDSLRYYNLHIIPEDIIKVQ